MDAERKKSKAICDAYVLAKEISLAAKKRESKHFDPIWLYQKVVALPEPPDARERRAAARALLHAGQAMLTARDQTWLRKFLRKQSCFCKIANRQRCEARQSRG